LRMTGESRSEARSATTQARTGSERLEEVGSAFESGSRAGRMGAVGILVAWLVAAFVGALATLWWSRRIWTRQRELPKSARIVTGILSAAAVLGGFGTVVGLVKAFGAVGGESVDPSQKARVLAEGIAEAMNCTAAGVVVWLPSVIVLMVVTRRRNGQTTDGRS
jgi:hypothetical protein